MWTACLAEECYIKPLWIKYLTINIHKISDSRSYFHSNIESGFELRLPLLEKIRTAQNTEKHKWVSPNPIIGQRVF
jgi:hypothetical protein